MGGKGGAKKGAGGGVGWVVGRWHEAGTSTVCPSAMHQSLPEAQMHNIFLPNPCCARSSPARRARRVPHHPGQHHHAAAGVPAHGAPAGPRAAGQGEPSILSRL